MTRAQNRPGEEQTRASRRRGHRAAERQRAPHVELVVRVSVAAGSVLPREPGGVAVGDDARRRVTKPRRETARGAAPGRRRFRDAGSISTRSDSAASASPETSSPTAARSPRRRGARPTKRATTPLPGPRRIRRRPPVNPRRGRRRRRAPGRTRDRRASRARSRHKQPSGETESRVSSGDARLEVEAAKRFDTPRFRRSPTPRIPRIERSGPARLRRAFGARASSSASRDAREMARDGRRPRDSRANDDALGSSRPPPTSARPETPPPPPIVSASPRRAPPTRTRARLHRATHARRRRGREGSSRRDARTSATAA